MSIENRSNLNIAEFTCDIITSLHKCLRRDAAFLEKMPNDDIKKSLTIFIEEIDTAITNQIRKEMKEMGK